MSCCKEGLDMQSISIPSRTMFAESPPRLPPFLHDNLIMEILSWLPIKLLMQFKLVCKSWKSLISDSRLMKLQQQRLSAKNADIRLMFGYPDKNSGKYRVSSCSGSSILENHLPIVAASRHDLEPLNKKYSFTEFRFIGTCNGLISLLNVLYDIMDQQYCYRVSLWNPFMNSMSQESQPLYSKEKCTFDFGFGYDYDYSSDTHKVVAISGRQMVKVYKMGGNCWRSIQSSLALSNAHLKQDGVYLKGTLNWIGHRDIVSFDLGKEKWAQLSLPCPLNLFDRANLGILRDCLCVFYDTPDRHLLVWQMKKFGIHKSWTQIMKFDYRRFHYPCYLHVTLVPLFMSENDDFLLLPVSLLPSMPPPLLLVYNEGHNRFEGKEIPGNNSWFSVKGYSESLVPPC